MNRTKPPLHHRRRPFFLLIVAVILLVPQQGGAQQAEGLAQHIRTALELNNEILAAKARWEESSARARQAGTLPDPRLSAEYFLQPIETRTGPQEASLSLSQTLPWFTKLSQDKKMKEEDSGIAAAMFADTQLLVVRKVKETFIEYGYLNQARSITGQIIELMSYLEGVAQTKFSSGSASYADVLKIQIELAKLRNQEKSLEDNTTPVRVRLNSLLGADRNMARQQPEALPAVALTAGENEIIEMARQFSPKILAGRQKIVRGQAGRAMSEADFYPDLTVSVKTIFTGEAQYGMPPDSGRDPLIAGISLNLPVFRERRHEAVAEKEAGIRSARNELEQTMKNLDTEIELALFRYREAERRLELFRNDLIPKVRQQFDVSLEAFQGGQYPAQDLIEAGKSWLNFELSAIRAQADMSLEVARMEELAGITLADWSEESNTPTT